MNFETIEWELKENGIGILTLKRPEKLNAISFQMEEELHSILDHLTMNLDCRVIILKGAGRGFCAGTDLQEGLILNSKKIQEEYKKYYFLDVAEPIKKRVYYQWRISQLIIKMRKISQPIIALIQGPAAGGGFSLILAADIRLASEEAQFINSPINIGLTGADIGASYFLPRLIGMSTAAEILYTGRTVNGKEAKELGLVSKLVEKDKLLDAAMELAKEMLKKSPLGLRMTKKALNLSLDSPSLDTIIQFENSSQVVTFSSKDMNEASSAFFEKRDPKYSLK
ncbi:MAG: enoyl-CoA hydratase/isomerase family protein [Candidatus Hodarchaeota archaeon]